MAAYRRVYDSHHLQADCQEPGSAPEPYARQSSMGYLELLRQKLDKSDEVDELIVWLCCVVNADRAGAAEAEVGQE